MGVTKRSVWDATQDRLDIVFRDFDNVIVAFSGGKDSGVMLSAVLDYMRAKGITRKITVMHLDYEGQYSQTTDYVTRVMTSDLDLIEPLWICLPFAASCSVSMYQDTWTPWNPDERDLWVRDMPEHPGVINTENVPEGFPEYLARDDYDVQREITLWHHEATGAKRTAVLIGIRGDESLHRYAVARSAKKRWMHDGRTWTTGLSPDAFNVYPIFDWRTDDVWVANARFGWDYNRLYDLMYQAGLTIDQMRVASPFRSEGQASLNLYRVIEPAMWARLVGRVNGANFTAIYGGTSAMGAKHVKLPAGHTWKSYLDFLLATLPAETRERYERKFAKSVRVWTEDAKESLSAETIAEMEKLKASGLIDFEVLDEPTTKRTFTQVRHYVRFADYPDDLPGITDFKAAPSYKRMVVAVLRNDHTCKTLGFAPTKFEADKRRAAIERYRAVL